jgi:hypothetical protein
LNSFPRTVQKTAHNAGSCNGLPILRRRKVALLAQRKSCFRYLCSVAKRTLGPSSSESLLKSTTSSAEKEHTAQTRSSSKNHVKHFRQGTTFFKKVDGKRSILIFRPKESKRKHAMIREGFEPSQISLQEVWRCHSVALALILRLNRSAI